MTSALAYLDTEFDGESDTLLSLALVFEDGTHFYVVVDDRAFDPWVVLHVLPILNAKPVGRPPARALLAHVLSPYSDVHIVADWPLDIAYFCELLISGPGECIRTPRLTFEWDRRLNSSDSRIPHNALEDAIAIQKMDRETRVPP